MAVHFLFLFCQWSGVALGKRAFKNKYQPENIEQSKTQPVEVKKNIYKIGKGILGISSSKELRLMVENGLLNYFVNETTEPANHNSISYLRLVERNDEKKYRRFRFYLSNHNKPEEGEIKINNPIIYYIEITSDCEGECTDEEFYKKGRLTYVGNGGLIL